jgi:hypothetical protein
MAIEVAPAVVAIDVRRTDASDKTATTLLQRTTIGHLTPATNITGVMNDRRRRLADAMALPSVIVKRHPIAPIRIRQRRRLLQSMAGSVRLRWKHLRRQTNSR